MQEQTNHNEFGQSSPNTEIPPYFKENILRIFGENGSKWLLKCDQIMGSCIKKWGLTNCQIADNLSINLICFADSPAFGQVVLKIGVPHPEFYTEIESLSYYNGRLTCKLFDYDKDLGAMLIEKIIPGNDLHSVQSSNERVTIAADMISKLPIPINSKHNLPDFSDWVNRAFKRARGENIIGKEMLEFIDAAEYFYNQISQANLPKVLLHGDLHHENMLQDMEGNWQIIDPKGVIGFPCLESGRFILNEIAKVDENSKHDHLKKTVIMISNITGEPLNLIAQSAYIDCILSRCWTFEEHLSPGELTEAKKESVNACGLYLNYVNSI